MDAFQNELINEVKLRQLRRQQMQARRRLFERSPTEITELTDFNGRRYFREHMPQFKRELSDACLSRKSARLQRRLSLAKQQFFGEKTRLAYAPAAMSESLKRALISKRIRELEREISGIKETDMKAMMRTHIRAQDMNNLILELKAVPKELKSISDISPKELKRISELELKMKVLRMDVERPGRCLMGEEVYY